MSIDLTGGLDVAREYVLPVCPDTPGMRDAVNMWVSDDRGVVGLPRFAVEAVSPDWYRHLLSVNIAYPDGRVLTVRDHGDAHDTTGPQGLPTVFGAGPLQFRCVEPFRRWDIAFTGLAEEMTTLGQMNGALPGGGPRTEVEFHIRAAIATSSCSAPRECCA